MEGMDMLILTMKMNLLNAKYELDDRPIEEGCACSHVKPIVGLI